MVQRGEARRGEARRGEARGGEGRGGDLQGASQLRQVDSRRLVLLTIGWCMAAVRGGGGGGGCEGNYSVGARELAATALPLSAAPNTMPA